MKRALWSLVLGALFVVPPAAAQPPGAGRAERPLLLEPRRGPELRQRPIPAEDANAQETLRRLQELLQQYPPSLGQVLALDPTLLNNSDYLQPYPALSNFLAQHPEIAHNPGFFLSQFREYGRRQYDYNDPRVQLVRTLNEAAA